jgi:hypothetical protein
LGFISLFFFFTSFSFWYFKQVGTDHWHVKGIHARLSFGYTENVNSQSLSTPEGVFFRAMTLVETHLLPRPVIHKRRWRTTLKESTLRTISHVASRNGGRPGSRPVEEALRAVRWNRAPKILGPPISATMCELRIDYRLN